MPNSKILVTVLCLLPLYNAYAGWNDLTGERKAAIGLGVVDIAVSVTEDKKAKEAAVEKLETLTYDSVYSTEDCQTKYGEVLTPKQLKSDKAWVSEVTGQIDSRCEQVMAANNERLQIEQAKQQELEAQQKIQRKSQRAQREYDESRAKFADIKSMASTYALERWQSLYNAEYRRIKKSTNSNLTADELKKAAHEFAECVQVRMAISNPNAPDSIIENLPHTFNDDERPDNYYEESFGVAREQCANPKYDGLF